ncbi:MAG: lipid-A-disaccharide synthase [Gammaproteobacteria bacterium]|nr:MAG: lipid-A-disaccharide synthase [Gammaproteobacteria bacterium]
MASPRLAVVAAEASGDLLAASLVRALRARRPGLRVEAVAGPRLRAEGVEVVARAEELAVMGLVEVAGSLPRLWRLRRALLGRWRREPPDLFVGVDAPDFNLGLEEALRRAGVPTVHYVSPSVWAWRRYRLRRIRRAADLVLTLFPFEPACYREAGIPALWVGHPLADAIEPLEGEARAARRRAAREALGLDGAGPVLALLPGSRRAEVEALGRPFLEAAARCRRALPGLRVVAAPADAAGEGRLRALAPAAPAAPAWATGRAREALAAADAALVASGTATLEALLLGCPQVVAYRLAPWTYRIARRLVRVPHVALPNLLAGEGLVPELLQEAVTPEALAEAVLPFLREPRRAEALRQRYRGLHARLRRGADGRAARAVLALLEEGGPTGLHDGIDDGIDDGDG